MPKRKPRQAKMSRYQGPDCVAGAQRGRLVVVQRRPTLLVGVRLVGENVTSFRNLRQCYLLFVRLK